MRLYVWAPQDCRKNEWKDLEGNRKWEGKKDYPGNILYWISWTFPFWGMSLRLVIRLNKKETICAWNWKTTKVFIKTIEKPQEFLILKSQLLETYVRQPDQKDKQRYIVHLFTHLVISYHTTIRCLSTQVF